MTHAVSVFRLTTFLLAGLLAGCDPGSPVDADAPSVHDLAGRGDTGRLLATIAGAGDVDHRDVCYRTPLMLAAQSGHLQTVTELIAAGARVDLHEKGYYTALMLAAGNGHSDVVRALAAAGAAVDEVEITRGWTALIWAAKRGHTETVRLLLTLGADPGRQDRQGRSARDWALAQGHDDVVALLRR